MITHQCAELYLESAGVSVLLYLTACSYWEVGFISCCKGRLDGVVRGEVLSKRRLDFTVSSLIGRVIVGFWEGGAGEKLADTLVSWGNNHKGRKMAVT